ncbi:tartrate dehydrogenase [Bryobacter aggregatus]|uniref:tartrate dehydrogenase n=1 Tax=Bryobacter aggregatus TaxID=360054 RepID=UPI0004E27984|nr:tartrate dehydrogenase [Bryobacter aggregatus]
MRNYKIASIAGDGIGLEVMPAARRILDAVARKHGFVLTYTDLPWSSQYYFDHGRMMPAGAIDTLRGFDAIFLGAVGHPDLPDHITLNGLLLPIRRAFDQYANIRPAVLFEGVDSPLKGKAPGSIDMMVVRENTEGEYAQVGGFVHHAHPGEVAIQTSVFTRMGCERIIRFAFELARKRNGRRLVTSITKSNAQGFSMVLWDRCFATVREQYPEIETESLLVDAAAMNFVRRPESFDVVVASNLFGDILSDISAIVSGSIGLAASANLDPERRYPSMFEPVHGSAPDIAGRGIANPLAMILSGAMMLDHLGEAAAGAAVTHAVRQVLSAGQFLPGDLGGRAGTAEIAEAVASFLS